MWFGDGYGISGRMSGLKEQPQGKAVPASRKTGIFGGSGKLFMPSGAVLTPKGFLEFSVLWVGRGECTQH